MSPREIKQMIASSLSLEVGSHREIWSGDIVVDISLYMDDVLISQVEFTTQVKEGED